MFITRLLIAAVYFALVLLGLVLLRPYTTSLDPAERVLTLVIVCLGAALLTLIMYVTTKALGGD